MADPMITLFTDMSEYLSVAQLAGVIANNCPDDQYGTPRSDGGYNPPNMPEDLYGNEDQKILLQYIRGTVVTGTWDSVETTDERVRNSTPGPLLFNVIVGMYTKWSRDWKAENPEPSPDSSYASVSSSRASSQPRSSSHDSQRHSSSYSSAASSRASSRAPRSHPQDSRRHSSTPSPRADWHSIPIPHNHTPGRSPRSRSPSARPGAARSELPDLLHQMKMACISE